MSINKVINQALDLMQGMAVLPFKATGEIFANQNSTISNYINQSVKLGEGLTTIPFTFAKDIFGETSRENSQEGEDSRQ